MRYHHKELGEPFNNAHSFGCQLEVWSKNAVIFPHDQTVQSYIAQNEGDFREPHNRLQRVHERHNTDVTQMIF